MTSTAVQPALQPASKKLQFASWPFFDFEEIEAASAVLRSGKVNYWTGKKGASLKLSLPNSAVPDTLCVWLMVFSPWS